MADRTCSRAETGRVAIGTWTGQSPAPAALVTGPELPEPLTYRLKRRLLGPALTRDQATHERLSKRLALGVLWVKQTFPLLLGWSLETHIPVGQIVFVCGVTLVVCWLAGLVPGQRAGSLKPADALRYE